MRSLPAIARLGDLDVVLATLRARDPGTVDDVRIAIGRTVEELAIRGEARQTRDWKHPLAYRDTAIDCLRELMGWNLIEGTPLGDGAEAFERTRNLPMRLTNEGARIADLGTAERREIYAQRLLVRYFLFHQVLEKLERSEILIPETSDSVIKACFRDAANVANDQDGWDQVALHCEQMFKDSHQSDIRLSPPPMRAKLGEGIGKYLRRRYLTKTPKSVKDVSGATNHAIAHVVLREIGFKGDRNAYDRCLRWARDLYLANDGRHVSGVSGWLAWSASKIKYSAGAIAIERRGVSQHREAVRGAIMEAYKNIAARERTEGVSVPLIPIYQVRETAAFACRVCDEVVDRVLGEMVSEKRTDDWLVQFHLGDLREFVPSARPFRFDGRRYFYISMYNPTAPAKGA